MILALYLLMAFLLIDIIRIANHFIHFLPDVSAFRFWATSISIVIVIATMIVGNYRFNHPEVVRLNIVSSRNGSQSKKIKIVAVSDLHLSYSIDKKRLQEQVEMINAEQPDLVLVAGDLIDRFVRPLLANKMDEELRRIKSTYGIYAVPGNHEYYGEGIDQSVNFYKQANITLLRDSVILIGNEIYVIGRDDATNSHRKSLSSLTNGLDTHIPKILLDHQPHHLSQAVENKIDFQFSGHTHNGQIFPITLIVKRVYEVPAGYKKIGDTHFFISSGLNIWGPQYRIGSQSEMVVIDFYY